MPSRAHWERIYATRAASDVSWFQAHDALSLKAIREAGMGPDAAIIDVGGGASTLVDDLLAQGYAHLAVLDVSGTALAMARERLGDSASRVEWIEADVLQAAFAEHAYDVWHDRAVFHFLTDEEARGIYVRQLSKAVKPGGLVIMATFAEDGPTRCSGLPVRRYSAEQLQAELGDAFTLLGHEKETHRTPGGKEQRFLYGFFEKVAP